MINWDDRLTMDGLSDLRAWLGHGIKKLVCAVKHHDWDDKNALYQRTVRCRRCKTRKR